MPPFCFKPHESHSPFILMIETGHHTAGVRQGIAISSHPFLGVFYSKSTEHVDGNNI